MLVRHKASHSPRPSVRCQERVPTSENWHRSIGLMTLVARHSSIAFRPAVVIWKRTTSTGLAPAFMVSRSAIASPTRTRPATMSLSNPWARTSSASVAPCGLLASSLSSSNVRRGCWLRRRFRMVVIRPVSDASYVLSINYSSVPLGCLGIGETWIARTPGIPETGRVSRGRVRLAGNHTQESNATPHRRVPMPRMCNFCYRVENATDKKISRCLCRCD